MSGFDYRGVARPRGVPDDEEPTSHGLVKVWPSGFVEIEGDGLYLPTHVEQALAILEALTVLKPVLERMKEGE